MADKRIQSIDIVRGLVMVIMALDHVRDLIHVHSLSQSPTDLTSTTAALFFTRWITYFCAPVFVFLSGTSLYLSVQKQQDLAASRRFLWKRGCWMLLLEFSIVNFALWFDIGFHLLIFEVIASFGVGFLVLGCLLGTPVKTIAALGLSIIVLHNLFPMIPFAEGSTLQAVLNPLFNPGSYSLGAGRVFIMAYPPVPWLGILLTGFASGVFFLESMAQRSRRFLHTGIAMLALFLVLRWLNVYGDPVPWSPQRNGLFSLLSFLNVTKYPPSLLFCLLTLGCMFLLLAAAEKSGNVWTKGLALYGKTALFYFIIHFFLIHFILLIVLYAQGFSWHQFDFATGRFGRPALGKSGLSLSAIYALWILVVLLMYPLCAAYAHYKYSHPEKKWLRYL